MIAVIATRRAGPHEDACPACGQPAERGQRLALVRGDGGGHAWIHVRHVIEQALAHTTDSPARR
jgi:hypothetical protein